MSLLGRKHHSNSGYFFPHEGTSGPLSTPLLTGSGVSYTGGKNWGRRNWASSVECHASSSWQLVTLLANPPGAGSSSAPTQHCLWPGGSVCLILDPIIKSIWLSYHAKLFIISNEHDILASICHPLFISQFVQSSDGKRGAIYWLPPKDLEYLVRNWRKRLYKAWYRASGNPRA